MQRKFYNLHYLFLKKMKTNLLFALLLVALWLGCGQPQTEPVAAVAPTTVLLVRHAEKADDGTNDPELTAEGAARAARLANMLANAGVSRIYSTGYKRTRLTAGPLADERQLEIQEYDPRDQEFITRLVQEHPGERILIVGHSNTVPGMVNTLTGDSSFGNLDDSEYDKLFIVNVSGGKGEALVLSY